MLDKNNNQPTTQRNVTLPPITKGAFPCPVCGEPRNVKPSKRGKPYIVCDECGVQLFIRNPKGISRFNDLVESGRAVGTAPAGKGRRAVEIFNEIERLKAKRKEISNKIGWSFFDDTGDKVLKVIDGDIAALQKELLSFQKNT
jgi:predicted RNA-binding Zn-ribbon protein involved in translation (DUF1610 family)